MGKLMKAEDMLVAIAGTLATGVDDRSVAVVTDFIKADRRAAVDACKAAGRAWVFSVIPVDGFTTPEMHRIRESQARHLEAALDAVLVDA